MRAVTTRRLGRVGMAGFLSIDHCLCVESKPRRITTVCMKTEGASKFLQVTVTKPLRESIPNATRANNFYPPLSIPPSTQRPSAAAPCYHISVKVPLRKERERGVRLSTEFHLSPLMNDAREVKVLLECREMSVI